MSAVRKRNADTSRSSNCRMRSRRLLRIRTEKTNTTNFWRGYAGARTTSVDNPSSQHVKNQHLASRRKSSAVSRAAKLRKLTKGRWGGKGTMSSTSQIPDAAGVSYSNIRRPTQSLPEFLKLAHTTSKRSSDVDQSSSKVHLQGLRDTCGSDLRSAAEFASSLSYALGAVSTLSTQASAQKTVRATDAFKKEVEKVTPSLPSTEGTSSEGRGGGGKRRRQSQRKVQHSDAGVSYFGESCQDPLTDFETKGDVKCSVLSSISSGLSRHYSSMCHKIAKQTITGATSGSTFQIALLKPGEKSSSTISSQTGPSAAVELRLASVNSLLDAFESISALQRRVQSRRTAGTLVGGSKESKPCSRDFTSKVLVYAQKKTKKAMIMPT